jgi:hypothetical protein
MSKLSDQVQNQIKVSEKVVASARTHARKVATELAARAAVAQGAETKATPKAYEAVVLSLADTLTYVAEQLRERELEYTAEQADDGPVRASRDAAERDITGMMTRLRSTVEDTLGREALAKYGLQGETPRGPRKALNHAQNVARLLRKSPATIETEFGSTFSTQAAAASLEKKHATLEALIKDDDREARELEDAMVKRDRAAATWSEVYQGVATALEGAYLLAGWRELADRVRPTQRTLRGEDAGPEIDEGGEPQEGGAGGATAIPAGDS